MTNEISSRGTPFRDEMRINIDDELNIWEKSSVTTKEHIGKPNVKQLLKGLPKPKNEYEIDDNFDELTNYDKTSDDAMDVDTDNNIIKDKEDINKKIEQDNEKLSELEFKNRTKVIQRNLLRPSEINYNYFSYLDNKLYNSENSLLKKSADLIRVEMLKLMENDGINFPLKHQKISNDMSFDFMSIPLELKEKAATIIENEKIRILSDNEIDSENKKLEYNRVWEENYDKVIFVPKHQQCEHKSLISNRDDLTEHYEFEFETKTKALKKDVALSKSYENKINILFKGYMNRYESLNKQYHILAGDIEKEKLMNKIYNKILIQEQLAISQRMKEKEDNIKLLKEKESKLQQRYRKFQEQLDDLMTL